jgi:hypothetical protein
MSNRPINFSGCAQVRTKLHRKDYDWSVGLVYDPRKLPEVTTARPGVDGVLQYISLIAGIHEMCPYSSTREASILLNEASIGD